LSCNIDVLGSLISGMFIVLVSVVFPSLLIYVAKL
jgi:hypothetical protein